MRLLPGAVAIGMLCSSGPAPAAEPPSTAAPQPAASLEPVRELQPPPGGDAARALPIVLRARRIEARPERDVLAEGEVEFRRGGLVLRADRVGYDLPQDRARAQGAVRIEREGAIYTGAELDLRVQRFEGWFLDPRFEFTQFGAGGRAERIDFLGAGRSRATQASYTSCPREAPMQGADEPAWVLKADRVTIDTDANEGRAEGAVLRFLGTPILALPALSFPLGEGRKSGWLPPSFGIDNRSGIDFSVPYYWNIADNRDATVAPRVITRRGFGVDAEFRYLEPAHAGELRLDALPDDRIERRARGGVWWQHESTLPFGVQARVDAARVSDANWWRDFPGRTRSLTSRLLTTRLALERPFGDGTGFGGLAYLRKTKWQLLQTADAPIVAPYERVPQAGLRLAARPGAWELAAEAEYNRFAPPADDGAAAPRVAGERVHLLASVAHPWRGGGWWLVPRLAVNSAGYRHDEPATGVRVRGSRTIPSFSVDTGLELERLTEAFGRPLRQTLEPRLLYVNTPFRAQAQLPNYDAAAKDFNFVSIYSDNAFSGVDRVSDSHQITAGFTTRLVDATSGAEALRLGLVQRYLLREQRVAPQADGSPDGPALTQRFSDALLLGSTSVLPGWTFDAAVQYSPDIQRAVRSILGVRYSPGPFRTVNTTYRFTRGLSEQVELGWQWPILERALAERGAGGGCRGSWYSVGRVNYSMKDKRITDSLLGVEYDAGCWIGRFVAERLSTGRSAATTRLLIQLELVGLSRLGSNPLKVLKENIPGYQLLREDRRGALPAGPGADERQP
jgi:LPS-assembly protein